MGGVRGRMNQAVILDAARKILDSGVFGDLTVDSMARRLKMSKSTLYKFFTSKEDVIQRLVFEACDITEMEVDRTLTGGTVELQLAEVIRVMGRFSGRLPRAVILELDETPETCQERVRNTEKLLDNAITSLVQQGVANKAFKHPKPKLVRQALMASARDLTQSIARRGANDYETAFAYLPDIFIPALKSGK